MTSPGRPRRRLGVLLVAAWSVAFGGCAVHYYDAKTQTEHLWGFGHLKMRAAPQKGDAPPYTNAVIAFATGVRTLGLNVGGGQDFAGLTAGWDSRARVVIATEDARFCLIWPTNSIRLPHDLKDLFTVRIGTNFPNIVSTQPKEIP